MEQSRLKLDWRVAQQDMQLAACNSQAACWYLIDSAAATATQRQ